MHRKAHTRVESGTCNVCSTPCSSCMHRKRAFMGSKGDEGDEFSDETCHVTETSQHSINKEDSLLTKVGTSDMLHATSAASNVPNAESSQDSLSASAETKANARISDRLHVSMKSEVLPESTRVGTVSVEPLSRKPELLAYKRSMSSKPANSKAVEGHDDNISSVTGADMNSPRDSGGKVPIQKNNLSSNANVENLIEDQIVRVHKETSSTERGSALMSKEVAHDILVHDNSAVQSRSATLGNASEVSSKLGKEIKEETIGDCGAGPNKVLTSSAKDEKVNESVGLTRARESPAESSSTNEGDDSEIVEQDVKVCDICGDAGQEDKLAVCSRCSDGAEHTYCMKEMLVEVPDGDWLCEECKLAEELENHNQGSEDKDVNKPTLESLKKRSAETLEVAASSKRLAVDVGSGSSKPSSPVKGPTLQRNSSSKSWDKEKVKSSHPVNDTTESPRFPSTGPRLLSPRGSLLKSNSFNANSSKPKPKLADEIPRKHQSFKESSLLDSKDGPGRMMGKSMSFHNPVSGRTESKVKMLSPKMAHVQDIKGVKQARDHITFERRHLPKLDRPSGTAGSSSKVATPKLEQKLTPRGEGVSSAGNSRELNAAAPDGKSGSLSRSNSSFSRKVDGPGTSVRASSIHGANIVSIERPTNQVTPKDEPSPSNSSSAERPVDNADENSIPGQHRLRKLPTQSEKSRESSGSRSRPAAAVALKETGQKKKEIGHSGENFTSISPRGPVSDAPGTKSVGDEINRDSKLKAAIEVAMLKRPGIYRKKHERDRPDGLSSLNVDVNPQKDPQAKFSGSNRLKTATFDERPHEEKPAIGPRSTDSLKQTNLESISAAFPLKVEPVAFAGRPTHIQSTIAEKTSPIPEHDFIWQGTFEVNRGGKVANIHGGIQAHLSTYASSKVLEVVNKFPENIRLDEVSRLSTWPRQFHEIGATGDNIALYFFARDLESYNKDYKGLLDNAMKRDLAFKGYFDGVELLIFPSTQLPEDSQCWNMMFFLWGVFKGRKSGPSDCLKKPIASSSNLMGQAVEIPTANVASPVDRRPPVYAAREASASDDRCNMAVSSSDSKSTCMAENGIMDERKIDSAIKSEQQNRSVCFEAATRVASSNLDISSCTTTANPVDIGHPESRDDTAEKSTSLVVNAKNDFNDKEEHKYLAASSFQGDENLRVENQKLAVYTIRENERGGGVNVLRDLNEEVVDMDIDTSDDDIESKSEKRKRPLLDLSATPPLSPGSTDHEMPWNNNAAVTGQDANKKQKLSYEGSESFPIAPAVERRYVKPPSEKNVVLESSKAGGRFLFPVENNNSQSVQENTQMRPNSIPWGRGSSSDHQSSTRQRIIPNLNLALEENETDTEPSPPASSAKGILPPFMAGKETSQNNPSPPVEEGVAAASLSLSLSFPFPDKEQQQQQTVKPEPPYVSAPFWKLRR